MTEPEPAIHAAPDELLALARAMRPQWDHNVLAGAIVAAKNAGWTWIRTFTVTARLLADEHASPWDLKHAAANPLTIAKAAPETGARGAAAARAALRARLPREHIDAVVATAQGETRQ